MTVHHGGKVGAAAKTLGSKSSGKVLKVKQVKHWLIIKQISIKNQGR